MPISDGYFGRVERIRQITSPASTKSKPTTPSTSSTCSRPNSTSPPPAEGILSSVAVMAEYFG